MTKGIVETTIESHEYNFVLISGLQEENNRLKNAVNEVLEVLNCEHGYPNTEWIKNKLTESLNT